LTLDDQEVTKLVSAALVCYMVVVAVYLWFIDLLAKQDQFGLFLATELAAFSMLIYVATKPTYQNVNRSWVLAGCASIVFFLTMILLK
jgi:hypothetical protein